MSLSPTYHESSLLTQMADGNAEAFKTLYASYWETLYNAAFKRLRNEDQSKDVVQEVFADIWTRRKQLQVNDLAAYLHTAVRFQVLKLLNTRQHIQGFLEPLEAMMAASQQADDHILHKELQQFIRHWMEQLPAKRREIFELYFIQEKNTQEIADMLQISRKTVQNQLGTAMQSLQTHLGMYLVALVVTQSI